MGTLTVTMTGSGSIGDLQPGWNIIEDATAVVASDQSSSTGSASMSAVKNDTSKYIVDNAATLSHEVLGSLQGFVGDTTETRGIGFGFTPLLSLLSVDRSAPPLGNTALSAAFTTYVSLVTSLITVSWEAAADPLVIFQGWTGNVWRRLNELCAAYRLEIAMSGSTMIVRDLGARTLDITDEASMSITRSTRSTGRKVNVCWYDQKFIPNLGATLYNYSANPSLESNATGWTGTSFGTGSSQGRQTSGGYVGPAWFRTIGTNVSLTSSTLTDDTYVIANDILHTIDVSGLVDGSSYTFSSYVLGTGSFSNVIPIFYLYQLRLQWKNAGGVVLATTNSPQLSYSPGAFGRISYASVKPVGATSLVVTMAGRLTTIIHHGVGVVVPPPTGTFTWGADAAMLSESLIAYFDGANGGSWSGTPNNSASTKPIAIENDFYNAFKDDNTIYEVRGGEVKQFVIQTQNYPTALGQPTYAISSVAINVGEYIVSGSDGLPVTAAAWRAYGGSVSVVIGEVPGTIQMTVTGPAGDIPGAPGPYSLSVGDGQNEYATLSIAGIGVVTARSEMDFNTGANPASTTNEYAPAIDIPFISTLEQAAYVATWAAVEAAGPMISATVQVKTESLSGFGLTQGALVTYKDCVYRIMHAEIGRVYTSLTLRWHTTLGAFDAPWIGVAIGGFDTLWSGYSAGDVQIAPMRAA